MLQRSLHVSYYYVLFVKINFYVQLLKLNFQGNDLNLMIESLKLKIPCKIETAVNLP